MQIVQIQTHAPTGGPRPLGTGEYDPQNNELSTTLVLNQGKEYNVDGKKVKVEHLQTTSGKNIYRVIISK